MSWEKVPQELKRLAESLSRKPATEKAANYIWSHAQRFQHDWQKKRTVTINDGLPLPPPRKQALHPRNCDVSETFLDFVFQPPDHDTEPFPRRADFQVRILGWLEISASTSVELEDHWRVDTHMFLNAESEGTSARPKEPHPLFHFQRGGHAQDRFVNHPGFVPGPILCQQSDPEMFRGLMQAPGPRMPVLPMCPILTIDFAIAQCDGATWRSLRAEPEYLCLIRGAQQRLWSPIFNALNTPEYRRRWIGPLLI